MGAIGFLHPFVMKQYIERTITWVDANGVTQSTTMQEAQYAPTRKGYSFKRWYVCTLCGMSAREDEVVMIHGKPYCIKNKCYLDA